MLLDISVSARSKKPAVARADRGQLRVVRGFEDGRIEVEDHRGRRSRGNIWVCCRCSKRIFRTPAITEAPKYCQPCNDAIYLERRQEMLEQGRARRVLMLEQGATSPQRRNAIFMLACVRWRDREAIKVVYAEARRKTEETGIPHDVDHIYPLQGALGCGLHVHWNLQVMPATENRSKGSSFPLDQSPVWNGCDDAEIFRECNKMIVEFERAS